MEYLARIPKSSPSHLQSSQRMPHPEGWGIFFCILAYSRSDSRLIRLVLPTTATEMAVPKR